MSRDHDVTDPTQLPTPSPGPGRRGFLGALGAVAAGLAAGPTVLEATRAAVSGHRVKPDRGGSTKRRR